MIDIPCFKCLVKGEVSPSKCNPGTCLKLELWLLRLGIEGEKGDEGKGCASASSPITESK